MKKLITTLLLVISSITFAQETLKKEFLVYLPMRTYHWDRSEATLQSFHKTEGGNFGAVFINRNYQSKKVYTEKQYGLIRNSYGDASFIIQQGVGYSLRNVNIQLSAGLASGYYKVYENGNLELLPGVFKNNGILPTIMSSFTYTKYKVQPTINISPTFINAGLIIKFI
jgi:hypothetical protein